MRFLALRGPLRQWLIRLHRWSGFLVLAFLMIAAATGIWLAFRQELDRLIHAELRVVVPAAARLSEDEIITRVETAFPARYVWLLQLPLRPDESVSLDLAPRRGGAMAGTVAGAVPGTVPAFDRVYVNPYTGRFLGTRNTLHGVSWDSLDSLILGLHFQLLAGAPGTWIMGLAALVWLLSSGFGLALAWPRLWRRFRSWLPIFSIRASNAYRLNYDLHRVSGACLLPVLTLLAFTSVELNLTAYFRPIVAWFSPLSSPPAGVRIAPEDAVVTFGQADAAVHRLFADAKTNNIFRDFNSGRYSVYFALPGDINPQGDNFALVDLKTAEVSAVRRPARGSSGDRFMAWLYPLHTGAAFGWTGRVLIALAGMALVALNVTSLHTWYSRWRKRRRAAARRRSLALAR